MRQEQIDTAIRRMEAVLAIQNGTHTDADLLAMAHQEIERRDSMIERLQSRMDLVEARANRLYAAAAAAGADVDTNGFPMVHREPEPIKADF